jgi:hypothetical protein
MRAACRETKATRAMRVTKVAIRPLLRTKMVTRAMRATRVTRATRYF